MPCRKEVLGSKQVYFNRSLKVMEEYPSLNNTTTNTSLFHNFCYKVVSGGADGPDGHDYVRMPAGDAGAGPDMGQGTSYGCSQHFLLLPFCSKVNRLSLIFNNPKNTFLRVKIQGSQYGNLMGHLYPQCGHYSS